MVKQFWEVDPLLCPHDIPVSTRDAHRVAHQRRADHRAHLAACWQVGVDWWVNEILNHGVCIAPWLDDQMPDYDCGL